MRFPSIHFVEQIEPKFRHIRDCLQEKQKQTSDCNRRALLFQLKLGRPLNPQLFRSQTIIATTIPKG